LELSEILLYRLANFFSLTFGIALRVSTFAPLF
jgi:hypothetical protein